MSFDTRFGYGTNGNRIGLMGSFLTVAMAASVILLHPGPGSSQVSDRVYPFTELSDEDVARLDLRDGAVFDWLDIVGEPSLTALDFHTNPLYSSYDPTSFDFRVWLAWHDPTNHLYMAVQSTDDAYINEYERYGGGYTRNIGVHDSAVFFHIDGDGSGGEWFTKDGASEEENLAMLNVQAQGYFAIAGNYDNDTNLQMLWNLVDQPHAPGFLLPPNADGGGGCVSEQPVICTVEFYVTAFDRLVWNNPGESVVSDLFPGKFIGFDIVLIDVEPSIYTQNNSEHALTPFSQERWNSSNWAKGLLVGADSGRADTAARDVTWGRIKASLTLE